MGIFKLASQGVGLAAEYNSHRRQRGQAREAAQREEEEEEERNASTSAAPRARGPNEAHSDLPPVYTESVHGPERSLARGNEASTSEKRTPSSYKDESDFDSDGSTLLEDDEEDWELDDLEREEAITPPGSAAASRTGLPSYEESVASDHQGHVDDLVHEVIAISKEGARTTSVIRETADIQTTYRPLPYPVILPQRRPRKKTRGFVRAYSPVLADCGIDQDTFLAFLKNFHQASQASPIFPVIQMSAAIAGLAPSVIAMAVCTAVQIVAQAGEEIQTRSRTNNFLDRMNDEFFKPHGLYAMIVKYKSDADIQAASQGRQGLLSSLIKAQNVNMSTNQSIAKYMRDPEQSTGSGSRGINERLQGLRLASDTTKGSIELPEAAPLIFPNIDYKLQHDGPETFKDKTKDAKEFLADYLDRRAQMQYAQQDPTSSLAVPEEQRSFGSKLADPSHPMYSGGLIGLLSGGKLTQRQAKFERLRERRMDKDVRRADRGRDFPGSREGKRARRHGENNFYELSGRAGGRGGFGGQRGGLLGQLAGATRGSNLSFGRSSSSIGLGPYDDHAGAAGPSSSNTSYNQRRGGQRGRGGAGGAVKRLMREDVLYLMIVNLPSEAELEEARQELEMARS